MPPGAVRRNSLLAHQLCESSRSIHGGATTAKYLVFSACYLLLNIAHPRFLSKGLDGRGQAPYAPCNMLYMLTDTQVKTPAHEALHARRGPSAACYWGRLLV